MIGYVLAGLAIILAMVAIATDLYIVGLAQDEAFAKVEADLRRRRY